MLNQLFLIKYAYICVCTCSVCWVKLILAYGQFHRASCKIKFTINGIRFVLIIELYQVFSVCAYACVYKDRMRENALSLKYDVLNETN